MMTTRNVIFGRSSSHFTRLVRIFAAELGIPYLFRPIFDITATDPATFGGNPALKMPVLAITATTDVADAADDNNTDRADDAPLFGSENICREFVRQSGRGRDVVMRGEVSDRVVANFEELTLHVMSSEVSLIFAKINNTEPSPRTLQSATGSLAWLESHVDSMIATLPPERAFSFVEVALFCLIAHLPFREVMSIEPYERLRAHANRFRQRPSARATEYRFDTPSP